MPILTAAGAYCTVLDYSPAQIESERLVAEREGYNIDIVQADMTKMLPFVDDHFDLVVNPVSLCYVREVEPIFREMARVLRPGGSLAFEVGEIRHGSLRMEELVLPAGAEAGLKPELILINEQEFTKTAHCWGVDNHTKGTNSNRIVLFRKS